MNKQNNEYPAPETPESSPDVVVESSAAKYFNALNLNGSAVAMYLSERGISPQDIETLTIQFIENDSNDRKQEMFAEIDNGNDGSKEVTQGEYYASSRRIDLYIDSALTSDFADVAQRVWTRRDQLQDEYNAEAQRHFEVVLLHELEHFILDVKNPHYHDEAVRLEEISSSVEKRLKRLRPALGAYAIGGMTGGVYAISSLDHTPTSVAAGLAAFVAGIAGSARHAKGVKNEVSHYTEELEAMTLSSELHHQCYQAEENEHPPFFSQLELKPLE